MARTSRTAASLSCLRIRHLIRPQAISQSSTSGASSTSGVALHRSVELVKGQQAIAIFVRLHEGRCRVLLLKLLLLLLLTLLLLPPLLLNFSFLLLILLLLLLPLLLPTDQTELPRLQRAFCIFSDHGDFLI